MLSKRKIVAVIAGIFLLGGTVTAGSAVWRASAPERLTHEATKELEALPTPKVSPSKTPVEPKRGLGSTYGVIRIPRMNLTFPLKEGTSEKILKRGVGHYTPTAQAGQLGNFAVAGHVCCASNGQPFKNLDLLREGDKIYVNTKVATYTYVVIPSTACGKTQSTVHESRVDVAWPVPCSEAKPTEKLMTLTTCTTFERPAPATYRRVVWAKLSVVSSR